MDQDSLQVFNSSTQSFMDILKIIVWPVVAIVIVLLLKKSITDLLGRVTKIGYGKLGAETQHKQSTTDKPPLVNETIQKVLGIFSQETIERAEKVVNNESKVEGISDDSDKVKTLHKYAQALYLIFTFERIYNIIFGSQLYILDCVNTESRETKTSLKRFYDSAVQNFPNFYSNYAYQEYFQFLITFELIIINDDETCHITWLGRDFLKYLVENGKPLMKQF